MVWPSSALGNRPYASPARPAVYKLVTASSQNVVFCSFSFQSLTHSFAGAHSTTLLQSVRSALFARNTGGRYSPRSLPFLFNVLSTLADPTCARFSQSRHPQDRCFTSSTGDSTLWRCTSLFTDHGAPITGQLSFRVMLPSNPFRSNTYKTFRKCSFQRSYSKAKSFRSNTYKKPGGGGYYG